MKSWLIILFVLVLIVSGDLLSHRALEQRSDALILDLEAIEKACLREDWKQAEQYFYRLEAQWQEDKGLLEALIDHSETEPIAMALRRIDVQITQQDAAVLSDIAELMLHLTHLSDRFEVTWVNLL